jgi:MarR family transcriptional regulator, transcriptional regulator for hemolysin
MLTDPSPTFGFLLHDVSRLFRKRFEQRARARELGLTRAQAAVLAHLARNEGLNQAALAQIMEIEPITLVALLDRLQTAELVERRADPNDRRARTLHLLPAAHPMLERIRALAAEVTDEALSGIEPAARDTMIKTMTIMRENLSAGDASIPSSEPQPARAVAAAPVRRASHG